MSKKEDAAAEAQVVKDEKAATKAAEKVEAHAALYARYVEQFGDAALPESAKASKAMEAALERGVKLSPSEVAALQ